MTTQIGHTLQGVLLAALVERGMTPADLARATGVSGTAARNWARGSSSPVASALPLIAQALQCEITTDGELWVFELADEGEGADV